MTTQTISTGRQIDVLKSEGKHFEAGQLARANGHDRNYGCHFGFRSTRDAAIAEFNRGWDTPIQHPAPTAEQVEAYLIDYYDKNYTTKSVHVGFVRPSDEADLAEIAVDVNVYVWFSDNTDEVHSWTVWTEDVGNGPFVYGEW